MHKLLLSVILSCFISISFAQEGAERIVLLEEFGNTYCPPCIFGEPDFEKLILEPYEDKGVIQISYHTPTPIADDVFFQANPIEIMERENYYRVPGVPFVYVMGELADQDTALLNVDELRPHLDQKSPIELTVTEEEKDGERKVNVKVKTVGERIKGDFVLRTVIVEKEVHYTPPHEGMLTKHHNIFRETIGGWEGKTFSAAPQNVSTTFKFDYTLDKEWVGDNIYVIAFVQNEATKEVVNAGSSWGNLTIITPPDPEEPADNPDVSTGVLLSDAIPQFSFYPNPVQDHLHITTEGVHTDYIGIQIFSLIGQQVYENEALRLKYKEATLDLSHLFKGTYIIRMKVDGEEIVKRLIKE